MYQILYDNNLNYEIINTITFEKIKIDPIPKLFHLDIFDTSIINSPTRENKYIAGILDLTKTYGKDGKFLYICRPDNNKLPFFLISYTIPVTFIKNIQYLYITFEYIHWKNELPRGSITQNFGCVNDPNNYYEYMLYCKSLNVSIQPFTKVVINEIKKMALNDENIRQAKIFTIDAEGSIDLDDAVSISDTTISIYITNVPFIIDKLNLWNSLTNRVSTIYLPDKKRPMLPSVLSQLCSLNEKQMRHCIVMDINKITNEYSLSLVQVNINKNYNYNSPELNTHADYQKIKEWIKGNTPQDTIEKLMILFNTNIASTLKESKCGIYKNCLHNVLDFMKHQSLSYELYNENVNYTHATSPIRRLVDILNLYQIQVLKNMYQYDSNAEVFYNKWINKIDYMNTCFKNIRKVQTNCKVISIFEKEKHNIFQGIVYKIKDEKDKYQVYIEDLKVHCSFKNNELIEFEKYNFKLYIFHDETNLKRKIRLQQI